MTGSSWVFLTPSCWEMISLTLLALDSRELDMLNFIGGFLLAGERGGSEGLEKTSCCLSI